MKRKVFFRMFLLPAEGRNSPIRLTEALRATRERAKEGLARVEAKLARRVLKTPRSSAKMNQPVQ